MRIMSLKIVDQCPTCGSNRVRQGSKDKVLIAWGFNGTGLIVELSKDGILATQTSDLSDWADEVFGSIDCPPNKKMSVWEGMVIINDDEQICKGKLRDLTVREWNCLKEGIPLW